MPLQAQQSDANASPFWFQASRSDNEKFPFPMTDRRDKEEAKQRIKDWKARGCALEAREDHIKWLDLIDRVSTNYLTTADAVAFKQHYEQSFGFSAFAHDWARQYLEYDREYADAPSANQRGARFAMALLRIRRHGELPPIGKPLLARDPRADVRQLPGAKQLQRREQHECLTQQWLEFYDRHALGEAADTDLLMHMLRYARREEATRQDQRCKERVDAVHKQQLVDDEAFWKLEKERVDKKWADKRRAGDKVRREEEREADELAATVSMAHARCPDAVPGLGLAPPANAKPKSLPLRTTPSCEPLLHGYQPLSGEQSRK